MRLLLGHAGGSLHRREEGDGGDSLLGMWDFLPLEKAGTCRKHGRRIFVLRSHPWRYLCADCDVELYGPVEAEVQRGPGDGHPLDVRRRRVLRRVSSSDARGIGRPDAVISEHMTAEKQGQKRADRNHERSAEAHWQVAEAGAEEEKRQPEPARQADEQEDDWENEGGAIGPEPRKTPKLRDGKTPKLRDGKTPKLRDESP
jgi:hypothetical protein